MNSVFSVDDISDWLIQSPAPASSAPEPPMNRSSSEWALEKFLEEVSASSSSASDNTAAAATPSIASRSPKSSRPEYGDDELMEVKKPQIPPPNHPHDHHHHQQHHHLHHPPPQPSDPASRAAPVDSDAYRAMLKSKLDLACAVVALSRINEGSSTNSNERLPVAEDQRMNSQNFQLGSQAFGVTHGIPTAQNEADGGALPVPALTVIPSKQEGQVRPTTSGSSREDSDDEDLEGDTGTNENTDPADAKRARRMQSNRESARRSRRRKQEQLNELETKVGQLRDERTTLLSRFTDINQKCDEAGVDNRILKANIETLRAKKGSASSGSIPANNGLFTNSDSLLIEVKMAEEQVKRVTGVYPMVLARPNTHGTGMHFVGGQLDASRNVNVPMQPNSNQLFHHQVPSITPPAPPLQRLHNSFHNNNNFVPHPSNMQTDNGTGNIGGMNSMPLAASGQNMVDVPPVQHAQKQIGSNIGPGGALSACDTGLPHAAAKDNKKK